MKRTLIVAAALILSIGTALASGKIHWTYSGNEGPENWGKLSPEFSMCAEGRNQSPIDLSGFVEADLEPIKFDYKADATEILNNGHAIQVNYAPGSSITLGGHSFELKQFHFHSPSENTIEGRSFPMEAHLVHADKDGNLAVVAVMFVEGASNSAVKALWKKMPKEEGVKNALKDGLSVTGVMPEGRDYYRFNGSLTTPPCTEGVAWLVLKDAVSVSKEQIEAFEHVMHHPTNRPVQPVNARAVLK